MELKLQIRNEHGEVLEEFDEDELREVRSAVREGRNHAQSLDLEKTVQTRTELLARFNQALEWSTSE